MEKREFNWQRAMPSVTTQNILDYVLITLRDAQKHRFVASDTIYIFISKEDVNKERKIIYFTNFTDDIDKSYILIHKLKYDSLSDEEQLPTTAETINNKIHKICEEMA